MADFYGMAYEYCWLACFAVVECNSQKMGLKQKCRVFDEDCIGECIRLS